MSFLGLRTRALGAAFLGCALGASGFGFAQTDEVGALVTRLRAADPSVRDAAAVAAPTLGSAAVAAIGGLLALEDLDVVSAAERALLGLIGRATAPGTAEGERAGTARALLDLLRLEMPLPAPKRAFLLRQIALIARGASETIEVARFLDDPALGEAALFALERIPSPVSDALLLDRLSRIDLVQPPRAALVATLGARRSRAAVPPLIELANDENAALAAAARDALARIGDASAAPVLRAAAQRGDAGAAEAYLRLLEQRLTLAHEAEEEATETLPPLLRAPAAGTRLAAIELLLARGLDASLATWIGMLGDPADGVRRRVQALLIARNDEQLAAALAEAAVQGTPPIRIGALQVIARRDPAQGRELLLAAAREGDASVRAAAFALLVEPDEPGDDPLFLAGLDQPEVAPAAAEALLARAKLRAQRGDAAGARALLLPLLAKPLEVQLLSPALLSLAPLADEACLAAIEPLAAREDLREEIAAVRLGIAERLPAEANERAQALLWQVVDATSDRERLRAAAAALKVRGVSPDAIAAKKGFLTRWKVMGSFARTDGKAFTWWPFADTGPTLQEAITIDDVAYAWRDAVTEDFEGHVDLRFLEPHENCYAFAAVDVEWPKDETVEVKLGSDDGVVLWVNGKLVHQNDVTRSLRTDEDRCTAELKQGANRFVVKIVQGGGGFAFCLRLPPH